MVFELWWKFYKDEFYCKTGDYRIISFLGIKTRAKNLHFLFYNHMSFSFSLGGKNFLKWKISYPNFQAIYNSHPKKFSIQIFVSSGATFFGKSTFLWHSPNLSYCQNIAQKSRSLNFSIVFIWRMGYQTKLGSNFFPSLKIEKIIASQWSIWERNV